MSTRAISSPIEGGSIDAAYNLTNTLLAVQQAERILLLARQRPQVEFSPLASLDLDSADREITCLAWAPPDQGAVLACGTADGKLLVWSGESPSQAPACAPPAAWTLRAKLGAGRQRVNHIAFNPTPSSSVSVLAVTCEDGFIRVFESDPRHEVTLAWQLVKALRVPSKHGAPSTLCWRDADCDDISGARLPAILAVGTQLGAALLWWREADGDWRRALELTDEQASQQAVSCIAWAPTMGRPQETVAVCRGKTVTLYQVKGPVDELESSVLARLDHHEPVWQAEWDAPGTWLATTTEGATICLWRPDFAGEWVLCNTIQGSPEPNDEPIQMSN